MLPEDHKVFNGSLLRIATRMIFNPLILFLLPSSPDFCSIGPYLNSMFIVPSHPYVIRGQSEIFPTDYLGSQTGVSYLADCPCRPAPWFVERLGYFSFSSLEDLLVVSGTIYALLKLNSQTITYYVMA